MILNYSTGYVATTLDRHGLTKTKTAGEASSHRTRNKADSQSVVGAVRGEVLVKSVCLFACRWSEGTAAGSGTPYAGR